MKLTSLLSQFFLITGLSIAGIDYHLTNTSAPLDTALSAYLATRGRRW